MAQTTTVHDYQFETLSNPVIGLQHTLLLSCFISGLKPHIKRVFQALQLINLMQPVDLAKLQEEIFFEMRKYNHSLHIRTALLLYQIRVSHPLLIYRYLKALFECTTEVPIRFGITRASRKSAMLVMTRYLGIRANENFFS